MKKLLYILALSGGMIMGCDPLDETYDEIESTVVDPASIQVFDYTLSDDDYESLEDYGVGTYGNFNSEDEAKEYVPGILNGQFGHLGDGSSITVAYNLYRGSSETVSTYTSADAYYLSDEDYATVSDEAGSAGFFNDTYTAADYLPTILASSIQDPIDGEIVIANYDYAAKEYEDISGEVVHTETFDEELSAEYTGYSLDTEGSEEWRWSSYSGDGYAYISAFNKGANEDWLVSPAFDLSGLSGATLNIYQAINYLSDYELGTDLDIKISTDYAGDVTTATWESAELSEWPEGSSWTFVNSLIDLSAYEDETIYVAFYYTSNADGAAAWEVSSVTVEVGESVPTDSYNVFYTYSEDDAAWEELDENVYMLSSADYNAMGAPGSYDNFSSSVPADSYVPTLLSMKYPYAQEEDEMVVLYRYYSSTSSSTSTRGNLYTYTSGEWVSYATETEATLQFGKEDGSWVPDNTIRYTLSGSDYSAIAANSDLGTESSRSNLGSYGNFSTYVWTTAEIQEAISYVLLTNFSDSEVGQKYLVTYNTYPGGDLQMHLILTSDGAYVPVD
ncbi:MAG: hypothetical protein CMO01_26475 [Thalassobius sp.]|nr:hypothetical protein [Thalassovita sp.]